MSLKALRRWHWIHKWTSLVPMVFLLMLCVTGLPLVFHHELDHALGYSIEPPALESGAGEKRAHLDAIIADAERRSPDEAVQFLVRDPEEPELWFVRMGETVDAPEASSFYIYDARTGEFLHSYPVGQGVLNFLFRLHTDMFVGLPGMLFLGFMGVLLLASLVSGAVLYGPYMRKLYFGTVRRNRSTRLKWLDTHNLLGIVTLVWLFVVGATGVVNTLAIPIFNNWQTTQLAEMIAAHAGGESPPERDGYGSVQRALEAARAATPDMQLSFMAFPGNAFAGPHHFVAFMQGETAWTSKLLQPVLADGHTGTALETRELPWDAQALLLSQPLHFGDYGGLPLKILWAVLDILAIIVLWSGLYLWWKRRNVSIEMWLAALENQKPERMPSASPGPAPRPAGTRLSGTQVWRTPVVLGLLSAVGLVAALLSDGLGDVVSWIALLVPVIIAFHYGIAATRS